MNCFDTKLTQNAYNLLKNNREPEEKGGQEEKNRGQEENHFNPYNQVVNYNGQAPLFTAKKKLKKKQTSNKLFISKYQR